MSQLSIYLDLDRTLYRTTAASMAKWQKISEWYPQIDAAVEHDRQHEFYHHYDGAYAYDFTAHITILDLPVDTIYDRLRQSELADGRMEYEGVCELVLWAQTVADVKILTYGIDDYQRLKASLCPSLRDIEIVTTLGSKGEYLRNKGRAWLVDDKPLGGELSTNVRFIQACLEGQVIESEPWPVVTTLQHARDLLRESLVEVSRRG